MPILALCATLSMDHLIMSKFLHITHNRPIYRTSSLGHYGIQCAFSLSTIAKPTKHTKLKDSIAGLLVGAILDSLLGLQVEYRRAFHWALQKADQMVTWKAYQRAVTGCNGRLIRGCLGRSITEQRQWCLTGCVWGHATGCKGRLVRGCLGRSVRGLTGGLIGGPQSGERRRHGRRRPGGYFGGPCIGPLRRHLCESMRLGRNISEMQ